MTKNDFEYTPKGKEKIIKISDYRKLRIYNSPKNCQLHFVDNTMKCLLADEQLTCDAIDTFVNRFFFVHVKKKSYIRKLQKRFDLVYLQKTPMGYNKTNQYHALFATKYINDHMSKYKSELGTVIKENKENV